MKPPRLELALRDGTPVIVRTLTMADREQTAEAYRRLSPESRYQRFWSPGGQELGAAMLTRLLDADQTNHAVWAVLDRALEAPGLGAASYWRSASDAAEAELSVTVADEHQRRGVGTLLLAVLWLWARRNGIRSLVAFTMPRNHRASRWMLDTGAHGHWDGHQAVFRWQLDDLDVLPPTPAGIDLAERLAELSAALLPP